MWRTTKRLFVVRCLAPELELAEWPMNSRSRAWLQYRNFYACASFIFVKFDFVKVKTAQQGAPSHSSRE
jgi:hypothetical protein